MGDTHRCIICGKSYKFCDSCRKACTYTPWRVIADTPECYQVHLLIGICRREDAGEEDYQNLAYLSAQVDMTEDVAAVVDQLLNNHK